MTGLHPLSRQSLRLYVSSAVPGPQWFAGKMNGLPTRRSQIGIFWALIGSGVPPAGVADVFEIREYPCECRDNDPHIHYA